MKKFFLSLRAKFVILSLSKDGVSLIIAIIFVSAFMLVIAGLAQAQLNTIRSIGNREAAAKVRFLADSAAEFAAYWASTQGIGANSAGVDLSVFNGILFHAASRAGISNCEDMDANPVNGQEPCMGFEVAGRQSALQGIRIFGAPPDYLSAPSAGTGNAGTCTNPSDADQACNWNRLYLGESVEIPLYYEMPDGAASAHNFGTAGKELRLRVRAPCGNFAASGFTGNCNLADRVTLYPPKANTTTSPESGYRRVNDAPRIPKDPVLIQWSISDFVSSGTSTLLARENTVEDPPGSGIKRRKISEGGGFGGGVSYTNQNTEISAGRINLAKDGLNLISHDPLENFTVLQYKAGSILDREKHRGLDLNRNLREIGSYISTFGNPVLRLTLVGQPQKDDGNPLMPQNINNHSLDVPFLEYQVLIDGIEIADSKSSIYAWAQIGDFRKELRKTFKREATLGGFALEQF